MEDIIVIHSDNSSDSIEEIEPPKKPSPVVINIDVEELLLDVSENKTQYLKSTFKNEAVPKESPGDCPSHWTEDMRRFYNDDWGDEQNFIVEKMQEKMDKQPRLWQVSQRDLLARKKKRNYKKCWNCCQFGHNIYKCKEPLRVPKCHMCGYPGHRDETCPNSICLNCGNQMRSFVTHCGKCAGEAYLRCTRCSLFGHHFINCSDNWRRFHSTIGKVEIDIPKQIIYKAENELWCCNCGKKGHSQIHCAAKKELCFPDTFPFIASYENSFNEPAINSTVTAPRKIHNWDQKFINREENRLKKNNNNICNGIRNLEKLYQIKKPNKRKRRKKDKYRNRNKFFQNPGFIPL